MREAMNRVYSWKQEHPDEYSRFSLDMMKVERNDFSSLERIFKMAVSFVPTHVLIECRKLLAPDSEEILSDDERTIAASRVVGELMGLKAYLRFGVYTETVEEKETPDQSEQFLKRILAYRTRIRVRKMANTYMFLPWQLRSFGSHCRPLFRWLYSLSGRDIPLMNWRLCQRESCCRLYKRYQRFSSNSVTKSMMVAILC